MSLLVRKINRCLYQYIDIKYSKILWSLKVKVLPLLVLFRTTPVPSLNSSALKDSRFLDTVRLDDFFAHAAMG